MKCSKCSGAGYIYNNLVGYAEDCSVCHGKGEVLTNEEWLRQCTTEQLAEVLCDIRYDYQVPWKNKGVVEWLKQPHREE